MPRSLLLVHSPLVGPRTMAPLAESLRERSFDVLVPDLTAVAHEPPPRWEWLCDAALDAASGVEHEIIVAGHSGAGALLPAIGRHLGERRGPLIFVDAVLPPTEGAHETSAALHDLLDARAVDGTLPKWLLWWPAETVERLLPDRATREQLVAEMPELPRSFYDEAIPTAPDWARWSCAYLQLSAAYDEELAEATVRGWPTISLDSTHLGLFTEPDAVATGITELLDALTA